MRARNVVPLSIRSSLRARHRAIALRHGIESLTRDPRGSEHLWRRLVYGWGNEGFASGADYLAAAAEGALETPGPVLECGSGLTTLVLAAVGQATGKEVLALEAQEMWYLHVRAMLDRFGLPAIVRLAPLRDYGDFDWYDVDPRAMPRFTLVVCDGPSGRTRGGRYGLLPVLGDHLGDRATILLDDLDRPGEQEVVQRWQRRKPMQTEIRGDRKPYAIVTVD
jgi:hypothetical protein